MRRHTAAAIDFVRAKLIFRGHAIGRRVRVGPGVRISGDAGGKVSLGERVKIGRSCTIQFRDEGISPTLEVGNRTYLQSNVHIITALGVSIGADCAVSWNVTILGSDFHEILEVDGTAKPVSAPIFIGNNVLVGAGASILKGTIIGDHCIVGAGAVVSGSFPPYSLIAGNPARVIRQINGWRL